MNWLRGTISALISGLIAAIGAAMAVWTALPPESALGDIPQLPMLIAAGTGALAFLKDAQNMLRAKVGAAPRRRVADREGA